MESIIRRGGLPPPPSLGGGALRFSCAIAVHKPPPQQKTSRRDHGERSWRERNRVAIPYSLLQTTTSVLHTNILPSLRAPGWLLEVNLCTPQRCYPLL
jgi:hypothetical protein